jgi:hypothetical protein
VNTFDILRRLWYFSNVPRHPLVRYEIRRIPRWDQYGRLFRRFYRWLTFGALGIIAFGALMEMFSLNRISFLMITITLFIPAFGVILLGLFILAAVLWQVPIALAGSGLIIHEKANRTWDLLRLTPLAHSDLLFAKLAVGLAQQQTFITTAAFFQVVPLFGLLGQVGGQILRLPSLLGLAVIAISAVLFVVERLQEFVLAGLIGVWASLTADTWTFATVGAVALSLSVFLVRILIAYTLVVLLAGGRAMDFGQVLLIGLPEVVPIAHNLVAGIGVLLLLILVQESVIRLLLHELTRRIGV